MANNICPKLKGIYLFTLIEPTGKQDLEYRSHSGHQVKILNKKSWKLRNKQAFAIKSLVDGWEGVVFENELTRNNL